MSTTVEMPVRVNPPPAEMGRPSPRAGRPWRRHPAKGAGRCSCPGPAGPPPCGRTRRSPGGGTLRAGPVGSRARPGRCPGTAGPRSGLLQIRDRVSVFFGVFKVGFQAGTAAVATARSAFAAPRAPAHPNRQAARESALRPPACLFNEHLFHAPRDLGRHRARSRASHSARVENREDSAPRRPSLATDTSSCAAMARPR